MPFYRPIGFKNNITRGPDIVNVVTDYFLPLMRTKAKGLMVGLITQPWTIATLADSNSKSINLPRRPYLQKPSFFKSNSIVTMSNNKSNQEQQEQHPNKHHLDAIFNQKKLLRSRIRKALKAMDPIVRSNEDNSIQSLVLEAPWFKSCQRLCAYISCSALREVDTSKLLFEILTNPGKDHMKKLYVPRVEDKDSHMRMLNISSMDDLIVNSMKILEPAPVDNDGNEREDAMQANDAVDLFLLPGLAFDRSGRRLGRGGGYYDTFLKSYLELAAARKWKQPLLVALSYSPQLVDEGVIPITPDDVLVDALVSPDGVIPISPVALDRSLWEIQ